MNKKIVLGIVIIVLILAVIVGVTLIPKDSKNNNIMSESEALKLAKEKYEQASKYYWGMLDYENSADDTENYFKVLNIAEVKKFFSTNGFKQYMDKNEFVVERDGEYYRVNADRGSDIFYIGNELKVIDIEENKIIFNSVEKFIANEEDVGKDENEVVETRNEEYKFILVKENNEWKVEDFTLSN